jgi:alginate O-acetyltransferase complex protein AlgI
MLFNSYSFVFTFLPLALIGFYALGHFGRASGAVWLVLTSLVFYSFWNPTYVLLLLGSIAFNFAISLRLEAAKDRPARQRAWLAFGIAVDIGILVYYKYLSALIGFATGLGLTSLHAPSILLPLGISFFTFTQIGYLVDVQQGVVQDRSPLNYMLFVSFFPHLIAGPILHNREIMPQFAQERTYRFSGENLAVGSVIFIIGLAKKCLFADPIAGLVTTGFADPAHLTMASAWMLMLTYAAQLYFDFSGYTDMAIGIARMFNVRFPANFNSPHKAGCIIEFWQRWHMTLTRLLTLYLFNPLVLAAVRRRTARGLPVDRKAQARPLAFLRMTAMPLFITMALAGIWHGAGLQFLVFGLLHGVSLTVNHAWRIIRPALWAAKPGRLERFGNWGLTLAAILMALVFFRAPGMAAALQTVSAMMGAHGSGIATQGLSSLAGPFGMIFAQHGAAAATTGLKSIEAAVQNGEVALLWFIILAMPNSQQIMNRYEPVLGRVTASRWPRLAWRPTPGWAMATGAIGAFAVMAIAGTTEFVYFQF